MSDHYPPRQMPMPSSESAVAMVQDWKKEYRMRKEAENTLLMLDTYILQLRSALKPFADLVTPALHDLPPNTKFAPKLTLEPFLAAHRALYGDDSEQP